MSAETPNSPDSPDTFAKSGNPADPAPLATGPRGMALLAWTPAGPAAREDDPAAAYVLVALWRAEALLLVRVRDRDCWELPGGGIEPAETARAAAVRELREETGERVDPGALRFAGHATTSLGPERRVLTGAVFTAPAPAAGGVFAADEEIAEVRWWDGVEALPRLQTVDVYLAALTRG